MRVRIENGILFLHHKDVPIYKKGGSVVRNSYFWALRAIAAQALRHKDWEYDVEVWLALQRLLLSFSESGYLGLQETLLEFSPIQGEIPPMLRPVATWSVADSEDGVEHETQRFPFNPIPPLRIAN